MKKHQLLEAQLWLNSPHAPVRMFATETLADASIMMLWCVFVCLHDVHSAMCTLCGCSIGLFQHLFPGSITDTRLRIIVKQINTLLPYPFGLTHAPVRMFATETLAALPDR
jgi:hypothetical protein